MKTITLQVHDISEHPTDYGWYYVITVDDDIITSVDWLRWGAGHWWWKDIQIDLEYSKLCYWFDVSPIEVSA